MLPGLCGRAITNFNPRTISPRMPFGAGFRKRPFSLEMSTPCRYSQRNRKSSSDCRNESRSSDTQITRGATGRGQVPCAMVWRLMSQWRGEGFAANYDVASEPFGKGAYGEVFLARDRHNGQWFAVKKVYRKKPCD